MHACEYWYGHSGTHQHGDAFELYCLVSGRSKSEVLRDLRADWIAQRRGPAIKAAAALSQPQTRIEADETREGALSASQASVVAVPLDPASLCKRFMYVWALSAAGAFIVLLWLACMDLE